MEQSKKDIEIAFKKAEKRKAEARANLYESIEKKNWDKSLYWLDQFNLRSETFWELYLAVFKSQ